MTQITSLHTYGIFAIEVISISIKKINDLGTVADAKATFMSGARPERKFELEHLRLLQSAVKATGVKLEVTPMLDGTLLDSVIFGVKLRSNITISAEGEAVVTGRVLTMTLKSVAWVSSC